MPVPLTTPDEWAAENRSYPASAGIPGPRDPKLTAYLIPFARRVHAGSHRRVVAVTAAQSGKTDNILDCIGARLAQRPAPILYVGPSNEFVTDQFEPRVMGMLDEAKALRDKVVRGRRMKKKLKLVSGVRVRLASAGVLDRTQVGPVRPWPCRRVRRDDRQHQRTRRPARPRGGPR